MADDTKKTEDKKEPVTEDTAIEKKADAAPSDVAQEKAQETAPAPVVVDAVREVSAEDILSATAPTNTELDSDEAVKKIKPKAKKRKRVIRQVAHGRAYVQATYNNTIVTLTDLNGNVLASSSAGQNGFKGPKKSTPYAAGVIVKNAVDKVRPYGLKDVNVFVKGIGSGRDAAVRGLNANGLTVLSIKDTTPIPHNGCRQRKPRRV
jgi:small subunit ribosomal protein S11